MNEPLPGDESFMSVREMVMEIRTDLKSLNAKVDALDGVEGDIQDYETRLRSLERWKYGIPFSGLAAVIAALIAVLERGGH